MTGWRDRSIEELPISVRTYHAIRPMTLGMLIRASDDELLRNPNFGRISLAEVRMVVAHELARMVDRRDEYIAKLEGAVRELMGKGISDD